MAEDVADTDIEERKDQSLRNVERLLKPSARRRYMSSEEKRKKNWGGESTLSTRRNGQEPLGVAEKPFPAVVNNTYHMFREALPIVVLRHPFTSPTSLS